jgi:uncharacterized protein (TIRG00374 family)
MAHNPDPMARRLKKLLFFVLRWGIAVVGMYVVISNISLYDGVYILNDDRTALERARLAEPVAEDFETARIVDPFTGQTRQVDRYGHDGIYTDADVSQVEVVRHVDGREVRQWRRLLAIQLRPDQTRVQRFVIADEQLQREYDDAPFWHGLARKLRLVGPPPGKGQIALWRDDEYRKPATRSADTQAASDEARRGPHIPGVLKHELQARRPAVQVGVLTLLHQARAGYLVLAMLIFPLTFALTSIRWHRMLHAVQVLVPLGRTVVINMVGAFYNTFMPGSTGGDVLKAYYASKQTPHRTRAVMTVLVDRAIGLLALVVVGGAMAAFVWSRSDVADPVGQLCGKIAKGAAIILAATVGMLLVYYQPHLRRLTGLDWLIRHLPMQKQIQNIVHVMEVYRTRPGLIAWAMVVTFPVHLTVATSAMLAGQALQLHIDPLYYFVCVPVIVLAGSIPISPQGAGVMEYFAIKLTEKQGASVSEAFALAMLIRLTQVLWNLTGGIFVLRGGFHAPSEEQRKEMETDEPNRAQTAPGQATPTVESGR